MMTEDDMGDGDVFKILKSRGPLSMAQICVELLVVDPEELRPLLTRMHGKGIIERRPEGSLTGDEVPWGLATR
jgi:hypothetical protein